MKNNQEKIKRRNKYLFIGFLIICIVLLSVCYTASRPQDSYTTVSRVIDGDTIELVDGRVVRYLGIDTPEMRSGNGAECGAQEARELNSLLVSGKTVRIVYDTTRIDRYGRDLGYVFTDDGLFVNYEIVRGGLAQVSGIPPDEMFTKTFTDAQDMARAENRGIWGMCFNRNRK